jgi:GDPmannose 4,6-dehydratase
MLQRPKSDDRVLAAGETHRVRVVAEKGYRRAGIHLDWQGECEDEKGLYSSSDRVPVEIDQRYSRPTAVNQLFGDRARLTRSRAGDAKQD